MKIKSEEDLFSTSFNNDFVGEVDQASPVTAAVCPPVSVDSETKAKIKKWEDEDEVATRSRLRASRNPRLKVKKENDPELWLDIKTIARYYEPIPDFPVDEEELDTDFVVPRLFLSKTFGGNCQETYPTFAKDKRKELEMQGFGDGEWACLHQHYNPFMPTRPGRPGLFFGSGDKCEIEKLEVKKKNGPPRRDRVIAWLKPNQWLYVGQYDVSFTSFLSKEEWLQLTPKVHKTWAKGVCEKEWGKGHRARIFLRNRPGANRQFTEAEFRQLSEGESNLKGRITEEQVIESFNRGEEFIFVYSMKCVGYEYDFQRKLVLEYPAWQEKMTATAKQEKSNKRTRKSEEDDEQAPRVRRVKKTSSSDMETEYVPRGTKSRPRRT
ncbi:hypothetical protein E1B28_008522 [Marasmius oreades]|uniref:DUF6697 domain-containing protein n=1 Tax=Marasmius oreades TaxID=181124 RepID=A0A9P7RZ59_9AGAR|nr:uncharacterized protein E1B28_008522 [Marasmius oreades]KAG7092153.1 hypothetical protein E1B28_008522 [Marasmius oreades]